VGSLTSVQDLARSRKRSTGKDKVCVSWEEPQRLTLGCVADGGRW
jgi:hypothetical protein